MLQTSIKKPLIIAGIVIGLSLVLGLGGIYVLAQQLASQTQAITLARLEASRIDTVAPRITALKAQEAPAAAYQRAITLLLPTQEQLFDMPRAIAQIAQGHSVDATFKFLGSAEQGTVQAGASLPFSLVASGSPEHLQDFLEDLEIKNPRYTISIGTVDVSASSVNPNSAQLTTTGNVYYQ